MGETDRILVHPESQIPYMQNQLLDWKQGFVCTDFLTQDEIEDCPHPMMCLHNGADVPGILSHFFLWCFMNSPFCALCAVTHTRKCKCSCIIPKHPKHLGRSAGQRCQSSTTEPTVLPRVPQLFPLSYPPCKHTAKPASGCHLALEVPLWLSLKQRGR